MQVADRRRDGAPAGRSTPREGGLSLGPAQRALPLAALGAWLGRHGQAGGGGAVQVPVVHARTHAVYLMGLPRCHQLPIEFKL